MSTIPTPVDGGELTDAKAAKRKSFRRGRAGSASQAKSWLSNPVASLVAIVIAVLWTIPTFGLFVTSFREQKDINRSGWWTSFTSPDKYTLENYQAALSPEGSSSLLDFFVNSLVITVPSVLLPLLLASLAAYAFAWIDFPGRNWLFVAVFALQIVPLQVALIPLLRLYTDAGLEGSYWTVWISHTIFALPLAIFLIHNFMKEIPASLMEAARVDGAGHVRIFFQLLMPLIGPALASFGIFQFLWVWNDLLVSLVFLGGDINLRPLTVHIAELSGTRGSAWHVLSAGAFVSMVVPVAVFLGLQRYFVRGLLAGGLKG